MSYIVVKTIKGKQYRYLQHSFRDGKKVRTRSMYLGPLRLLRAIGDLIEANRTRSYGYDEEKALKQFNERIANDKAAKQAALGRLHDAYGLKLGPENPAPVDKISAPESAEPAPDATTEPAAAEGPASDAEPSADQ